MTGYSLAWGENSPYQFSSKPLTGDETQYLIKELSKCIICAEQCCDVVVLVQLWCKWITKGDNRK